MAYVGNPIDTQNTFQSLQGKRFSGDGSETEFTLDVAPGNVLDIEVFVGNVRQDPNSAYTVSGTTLSFTGAPPSGTNNIYVVHQAKSVGTINPGANSVGVTELNLSDGSNGQAITTNGSGTLSFSTISGTTINNNADNRVITGSGTANTLEGEASLTFDGTNLDLPDSKLMRFGTGNDFSIQFNGSNTILAHSGGDFQIRAGNTGENFYIYNHNASSQWFKITGTNGYIQAIGVYNQSAGDSANVVIDGSGNLYRSTSALKYKQDVRDLESIDISSFRPVRYKSKSPKDDPNKDFIGFIADEFHDAGLTELVSYGNDSDGKPTVVEGFNYDRLTVILTKALQEANAKIATLETKVKALEEA